MVVEAGVYICTSELVIITGYKCKTERKFLELPVNKWMAAMGWGYQDPNLSQLY